MYLVFFIMAVFEVVLTSALLKPLPRDRRMVGGKNSSIEEFPFLVALEYKSKLVCSGTIISRYHVITAGHCLRYKQEPRSYQVRAGSSIKGQGGSVHRIRVIKLHQNFTRFGKNGMPFNDVAVLRLENPIAFDNKTKKPIRMFEPDEECKSGSAATIAGWGWLDFDKPFSEQLHSIKLNIVDKKRCSDSWMRIIRGILDWQICASDDNEKQSACRGDSGGPLVVDGKLAGIASYGVMSCTSKPKPNVFTEVSHFRRWIDRTVMALSNRNVSRTV